MKQNGASQSDAFGSSASGIVCGLELSSSNPNPPSNNNPPSGGGAPGTIGSFIDQNTFTQALSACGINRPDIYSALIGGFTAKIHGLDELALLVGNLAHESGAFQYTEEIACAGVTQVTSQCPYGLYHGRGYIQISWQYNYQSCADYWNNQQIVTNPDIVKNDQTVNWQTVQWFWTTSVQPVLLRDGYTLGASVRAINGGIECDSGPIAAQRVQYIQCFEKNFGVPVDYNTQCPASALADTQANTFSPSSETNSIPTFAIVLVALGAIVIILVITLIVLLSLMLLGKSKKSTEYA